MIASRLKSRRVGASILALALMGAGNVCLAHGPAARVGAQSEKTEVYHPERPGLLILSHGAPSPQWNGPVNRLVEATQTLNKSLKAFHAIEGAFLEFAQPDAATAVEQLEAVGCDHIVVVPLFIAPSSHSHFDVPAVLGLYSSPAIRSVLEDEGARIARPRVPMTVTQTLGEGDLLDRYARDEIRSMSKDPSREAVVVIAHGCPDHTGLVDRMSCRVMSYCCGQLGIDYGEWAYCAVGQTFWEDAAPAVARAAEHKKRVLVVGLYVSSSAARVYDRAVKTARGPMGTEFENPFEGKEIVFSKQGVVHHPDTPKWLIEAAAATLE